MQAKQGRIGVGAERVDVVQKQVLELRAFGKEAGKHAVAKEVRHFVPMADGMKALEGKIVRVVGRLAGGARPTDERIAKAVAHLLLLFVKDLLRHFFPRETQVAHGRHQAQPDGFARRKPQRPIVTVVLLMSEELRQRRVREVARREDMRQRGAKRAGHAAALGQMRLDERAMPAAQFAERVQRFHHARALRPARAGTRGQRDDGELAATERLLAQQAPPLYL